MRLCISITQEQWRRVEATRNNLSMSKHVSQLIEIGLEVKSKGKT
ncbi:MAG TPA: hypothetical protein VFA69_06070 [Candidatus Nitrosotalea sp.]|nr:hypothetical protein [Candidatus Nitrosotalea sp.]